MNNTLSHIEIDILKYLDANVDITRSEAFQLFLASDYSLNNLLENGYILKAAPNTSLLLLKEFLILMTTKFLCLSKQKNCNA